MADRVGCLLILISLMLISGKVKSQSVTDEKEYQIEQVVESMGEAGDEESDNSLVLDDLVRYSENPLNINTASAPEFEQLHLLDLKQIQDILNYRKTNGSIISVYELNAIQSLSPGTIQALQPFLIFDKPDTLIRRKRVNEKLLFRSKTSFPIAKGYSSPSEKKGAAYPGLPLSFYSRYRLEIPGKLDLGFITDQDAGEEFFQRSNPRGFDYYSGFISWQSKSIVQQVTIGDYYLKFGQGLNFWSGSGIGKSSNTVNIMKMGQGVRPYTSTDENLYFRGIAAVLGRKSVKMILFYSNKRRDANLSLDKTSGDTVFTSLKTGGYHRTNAEIDDENSVSEQEIGGYAEWRTNNFRLGALVCQQQFNLKMITGNSAYKAKSFSGNENTNMGIDYQLALKKMQLFGEAALSMNRKPAFIQGLIWHAHPQLNLSLYYRYFDPAFHSFYGNPLSEGSEGRNEKGLYTGFEIYPIARVKITGYADFYHFPFLTYSTLAPSSGRDLFVQVNFSLWKKFNFYFRGKFETKPQKYSKAEDPFDFEEKVNKMRLCTDWQISERFSLKNRFEYVNYAFYQTSETGYLICQDFDFRLFRKMDFSARYAYFHTDGYNSRIYTYEEDLLYSFSFPEFHGKGHRIYLNLKWQPAKVVAIYLKAGRTFHEDVQSWGTGNDLTLGKCRTELKGELYFRF